MEMQFKRFLSFVLALVMVLSYVPVSAFATDNATDNTTTSEETSQGSTTESSEAAEEPSESADDGIAVIDETDTTIDTEEELKNALTTGGNVVLGGNIEVANTLVVPNGVTVNLDLGGYTLSGAATSDTRHIYPIANCGNLTISNGTVTGRGIYTGSSDTGTTVYADAVLTINGATVIAQDWNGGAGVWGYGGSVYLNNANITGNTGVVSSQGYLEINGGTYTCYSGIADDGTQVTAPTYNIRAYNGLKITDGTFTSRHGVISLGGGTGVIKGGSYTIIFASATTSNVVYTNGDAQLTIDGGEFISTDPNGVADSGAAVVVSGADAAVVINDGTYVGMNGSVSGNTNTVINGGSYDNAWDYDAWDDITDYVAPGTTVTVEGETVAKSEDGSVVTNPVAVIGSTYYNDVAAALAAAAAMTGDVTVEIYEKVTLNSNLSGSFDSIKFVGKDTDAEIYLDVQGYITATGKKVAFENLTLSKSVGGFIPNAGFMNVAFGVYEATEVTYTGCTFSNGSYASGEKTKVTYTGCTFYRSHDKYGLWAYGADVTVDGCTFADYRGIKMYAEGAAKTTDLTVKDTDFSAVDDKPAIVLTYGESVALEGNTYSSTGVFELDLDGAPNGTPITSDVAPTCVNDNGACGVLVDGKIYTTVAKAAEVATSGSTVTLLHNSTETVELPVGVTLNKNGYTAENVTVAQPAGPVEVATEDELKAALANGGEIKLTADIDITARFTTTANATIDLNGKTLNIKVDEVNFSGCEVTIKNGTIDVSGVVATADAIFNIGKTNAATLTLDTVAVKGETYSSAFGVFYIRANSTLNINGGSVNLSDEQARYSYGATSGGVFKADGSSAALNITGVTMELYNVQKVITHATTAITNSTISIKGDAEVSDKMEHGINRSALTVTNSTITMENLYGRGITAENGAVSISDNSTVTITNAQEATIDVRGGQTVKVDPTSTVTVDADPTITSGTISGDVTIKITPAGEIQLAYLGAKYMNGVDAFFGEAVNVVAKESFVVKLYFGETLVGTAELVDTNKVLLNGVSQTVTWHAALADDGDSWWNTTWNTTLNVNNIPDKVELWVDGVLVDTDVVELNNTDLSYPICAAVTDAEGNIQSFVAGTGHLNAQTPPDYDEALQAAFTAGGNIVMLRDVTVNSMLTVADTNVTLDLNGKTITAGTLPENSNMVLYIINSATVTINDSVGTGGITNSSSYGYAVLNQGTLTVNGGTFVGDTALWNGYDTINSVATLNGGTFDYNGSEDEGYSIGNAGTLVINNGAVVGDWLDTFGTLTINGGTVDNVYVNTGRATVATAVTTISGGNVTGELSVDEAVADSVSITGGTFATDPTAYVAEGYAALPNLNDQYVVGEKPTATVKDMGQLTVPAGDYMIYGNGDDTVDMPLNFVMQFLADQTEEDMETSPYADWYGDFVITITGLENGSFTADDCYLAGYYGSFGWIQVPIDGMTIEEGARYPVMLGVGMGQKYDYICTGVKDFRCAMYIAPEILEANPNINVTLELSVVDSSKGEDAATEALVNKTNIYQVANLDYEAEDFKPTVAKIGEVEYKSLAEAIAAAKAGDTVTIVADGTYKIPGFSKEITIAGAEGVNAVIDMSNAVTLNGAKVTFENLTFNYAETSTYKGFQHVDTVVYNNCVINGQMFLYGNSETFNNCTFNQTSKDAYNVWTYSAKEVTFNECTFNSAGKSVLVYNEGACATDLTVEGTTFNASEAVEGKAAIEIDTSLMPAGTEIVVDAETTAIGFATGSVSGSTLWNNKMDNKTEANNDITVVVSNEVVLEPLALVAETNGTKYTSLADAVAAAKSGATVTLLDNATGAGVVFKNGKNVVIDLNNYTYTLNKSVGSSAQYGTVGFYLHAGSNVTMKNGTINMVADEMGDDVTFFKMFHTYGDLTLTDVTLDCVNGVAYNGSTDVGFIAVESDNGTVTIDGSTSIINAELSPETWTVTAYNNGKITIDTTGTIEGVIASYGSNASVEIENGTFTSTNTTYGQLTNLSSGAIAVSGGTFSEEVAGDNCAEGFIPTANANGTYGVVVEANKVAEIDGMSYVSIADAVTAAKAGDTIVVTADHAITAPAVVESDVTIDLNGKALTAEGIYPVIRVQSNASVTIENGSITADDYVFVLGASDASSSGYLTIKSGSYRGVTTVASVTMGELVIEGGYFAVDPYSGAGYANYNYLLNCIDANYAYGTANIVVKGGSFENFNPADNAAEGVGTNFVDPLYESVTSNGAVWNVREIASGDERNPIDLTSDLLYEGDFSATVTVPAGNTYYFQAYRVGGMIMSINGGEGVDCVTSDMWTPYTWSITNDGAEAAEYVITVYYPVGDQMNPAQLVIGDNTATIAAGNTQGYYFTWTAADNGALTITMPEGNWMYVINNITTYSYGDTQWSDSDPVANPAIVEFAAGDELQIMVSTYDPANPWSAPAGEITFNVAEGYPAGHEKNPILLLNQQNAVTVSGETWYQGRFSGMIMTVTGEGEFSVIYNGETTAAVDGKVEMAVASANPRMPVIFAVDGEGDYSIDFTYPVGSMSNPAELVMGENTATIEANAQGYYYTWTATGDGELTITMPEGNWSYVINNMTTYSYGDAQFSDSDPVANPAVVAVNKGDELQIIVNTYDPAAWATPAGVITFTAEFTEAPGTEANPILLQNQENDVAQSGETWYQGRFSGMIMTVTGEGEFSVIYNGETTAAVDGKVEMAVASANPRMPVIFAVDGEGDYSIDFAYPLGNMDNPAQLVMGENTAVIEANAQGYYYTWTATGDGALTITMPEGNWSYVINNMTTYSYGDAQFSDSDPVANPAVVAVNQGDELQIIVNTYDPAAWATPAGVITFTAEFMVPVAQNETTGVKYGSVSEALAAAASGETVILLADAEEDLVYVRAGRTLNLNGKTLTANDVLAVKSAHIVDNSAANTGLLAVAADNVMISSTNSQLPVWNGTGYVFTAVDFSRTLLDNQTEDSFRFVFQPQFQAGAKALIENGVEDNDVTIEVRVSWMSDQGREYRNLIFKESQIITAISNANGAFILTFSGFSTIAMESDITVEAVVNSGTGVSAASAGTTVSIGK